jgi:HEAT repeat protein
VNEKVLQLFRSENLTVRTRAAAMLLDEDVPLPMLLEILDELHDQGLGAETERVLLRRSDAELIPEMIHRMKSPDLFVKEVACRVLGQMGGPEATPHLVTALRDPSMWIRRTAGFALATLKDPRSADALVQRYREAAREDPNVILALECALKALGVPFERHRQ